MDLIAYGFKWLFQTRTGVITLLVGGIVLFFVISAVLEVRTRARYKNHEKSPDDWTSSTTRAVGATSRATTTNRADP